MPAFNVTDGCLCLHCQCYWNKVKKRKSPQSLEKLEHLATLNLSDFILQPLKVIRDLNWGPSDPEADDKTMCHPASLWHIVSIPPEINTVTLKLYFTHKCTQIKCDSFILNYLTSSYLFSCNLNLLLLSLLQAAMCQHQCPSLKAFSSCPLKSNFC